MPSATGPRQCARGLGQHGVQLWALLLAGLTAAPTVAQATQPAPKPRWVAPERAPYRGETFPLRLEVELDDHWSRERLAQLFATELDLPIQIDALSNPPPQLVLDPWIQGTNASLVVDGQVVRSVSDGTLEGRRRVTIERNARATVAAEVELPAPRVVFSVIAGVQEDALRGQQVQNLEGVGAVGSPLRIRTVSLPEEGRPVEFSGAIGAFSLGLQVEPRNVAVGESITLTVDVLGEGALPSSAQPRLNLEPGDFEWLGTTGDDADPRRFTYELRALRAGLAQSPDATLAVFDPEPGTYRTLSAPGAPMLVRPRPQGATPQEGKSDAKSPASLPWTIMTLGAVAIIAVVSAVRRNAHRERMRAGLQASPRSGLSSGSSSGTSSGPPISGDQ